VPIDSSTIFGGRTTCLDRPVGRLNLRETEEPVEGTLDESDSELEATRFAFNHVSVSLRFLNLL
jgi:hypothetical protein